MNNITVPSYGETFGSDNSPIAQVVINFFENEIIIVGNDITKNELLISSKRELMEKIFETHKFAFLNYGSDFISNLVDDLEFLNYIIGLLSEKLKLISNKSLIKGIVQQEIVVEYYNIKEDKNEIDIFSFQQSNYLEHIHQYHFFSLLSAKSLVFEILYKLHTLDITYSKICDTNYQIIFNHNHELNKLKNEQE